MSEEVTRSAEQLFHAAIEQVNVSKPLNLAQGDFGEAYAKEVLGGDRESIHQLLSVWGSAEVEGKSGKGKAANIPDWLVLDGNTITHFVEVKAVRSDLETINQQRKNYRRVWVESFPEMTRGIDEESWQERINYFWRGMADIIVHQIRRHIERGLELSKADIITVAEYPKTMLFIPEGQGFGEWPEGVRYRDRNNQVQYAPLEIRYLPPLEEITQALLDKGVQTQVEKGGKTSQEPSQTVRERAGLMKQMYSIFCQALNSGTVQQSDSAIVKILFGDGTEVSPEDILYYLSSTSPCLTAHFTFETAGSNLPGISKIKHLKYQEWLSEKGLDSSQSLSILLTLNKMQAELRKRKGLVGQVPEDLNL